MRSKIAGSQVENNVEIAGSQVENNVGPCIFEQQQFIQHSLFFFTS